MNEVAKKPLQSKGMEKGMLDDVMGFLTILEILTIWLWVQKTMEGAMKTLSRRSQFYIF